MAFKDFRVSPGLFLGALLLLVGGVLLIGAGWWLRPIAEADAATRAGDTERALERYTTAERRFGRIPATRRLAPDLYNLVVANHLSLLYRLQRYDAVIDQSAGGGGDEAAPFWAGCALFSKGAMETRPEARLGWLAQSQEEFRRALEQTSGDWDAKFNYELTGRLIAELRKQPKTGKQEMMQLLRQPPKSQKEPARKVG